MINGRKSTFLSIFCSNGPGRGPDRSVFSLYFDENLVHFWSDFGHILSGFSIGGTASGLFTIFC